MSGVAALTRTARVIVWPDELSRGALQELQQEDAIVKRAAPVAYLSTAPVPLKTLTGIPIDFEPKTQDDLARALTDPVWRVCSGRLYKIMVKEGEGDSIVPFSPNRAQRRLIARLHNRNLILKARQLGFTTLACILWLDHALFNANQRCGIVAQDKEAAESIFRDKVKLAYEHLPEQLRVAMPLAKDSATELLFGHNNSSVRVATSMRSGTIHRLHVCLSGDTDVLLKDGLTKPIREVCEGDLVMTGRASYLPVQSIVKNRIEDVGEPLLSLDIHGWHKPLKLTANHSILTREFKTGTPVWKQAGEVDRGDYIAFPVREISNKLRDKCLPFGAQKVLFDGGRRVKDKGRRIPVTRDLGILVGMYLAEGHIRRTETSFALHRGEEVAWFCKLLESFSDFFASYRVYDHRLSLTTQVVVNGTEFAQFLSSFFGDGSDKRIPDAVWCYGRQFVDGLIWGYLQGDGCFSNPREVQVTSIRPQLINQMRMLLLSTRLGASSTYYRKAGLYYGRNCKETWVLKMHGAANWKFREHFGLPLPEITSGIGKIALAMPGKRNPVSRKNWRRGKDHYWMRIKSVEIAEDEEFVYDLVLPKEPHNYVTVNGVVHNSEFGKICAKYPDKAREVVTGSLPAVPLDGIAIIESTAEGQEGEFYKMTQRAIGQAQQGVALTQKDFRMHFYAWWQAPEYRIVSDAVVMGDRERAYFQQVEAETGTILDPEQRNWYVATRDAEFSGDPEKMWQEYPSTAKEAFQASTEGCYYAAQLSAARKEGRICRVPHTPGYPVNTFWDIGSTDGTAVWLHQQIGYENRFIGFIEGWGESYSFYTKQLQALKYVWGVHHLPHDAKHKRQQGTKVASPEDELRELGLGGQWQIVDAVDEVIHGIQKCRDNFHTYVFDEEGCALGLAHLGNYRKTWNKARGGWNATVPSKVEGHSEAADALRQHAQGYLPVSLVKKRARSGNWRTA